ncbi:hypothetical protein [Tahibacter soli]|uniref:Uncharacterized protein n=1 Tax=Tahibacter soli TaxID=2983605 RepID=A0A9X3YNK6_9GAMM|nr:hypothetical protein [Tahibacter soli]MDC8014615.1 hypothetical protein [Tahibacter soli]
MRERVLRKLRTLWRRVFPRAPACRIEAVGEARLAIDPEYPAVVREYYAHVVGLFRRALAERDAAVNLVFGDLPADFGNANPVRRIDLQWEHTLVKPGGRDSDGAPVGDVPLMDGAGRYLARVANRAHLETCDAIVDYSRANVENLRRAGGFEAYLAKTIVVAPLLYDIDTTQGRRRRDAITLFADLSQTRRRAFLDAARAARLPLANVNGIYGGDALRALYRDTRVLVNVHQTGEHHTFEELRVLPALLCGAVVVSEDVPLRETIPYHAFVVWARYGELADTVRAVLADDAAYRERIFGGGRFEALVERMRRDDRDAVGALVTRFVATGLLSVEPTI